MSKVAVPVSEMGYPASTAFIMREYSCGFVSRSKRATVDTDTNPVLKNEKKKKQFSNKIEIKVFRLLTVHR